MVQSPEKVLKSLNFTSLSEKSLISIIKNDDLQMKEIEVWEHVLKWGLAQNPTLILDPKLGQMMILNNEWIDKIVINDNNFNESYLPYKFELLLKGSRDGFTPKKFHELCDNRPKTVTFIKIKIKGTEEIIGGYNPVIWESSVIWGETKDSFIFSFKNKNNFKDAILSYIKISGHAIANHPEVGPKFGHDIIIGAQMHLQIMMSLNVRSIIMKKR
ncbi:unnamed protein product [Rhizophagus irregularis]|nr:unnamed protein product [Rhizophagus irregularis]